jgi:NAD(P)-dependent dehydrogenase (short-subunit alcohol dehydrogenase family)
MKTILITGGANGIGKGIAMYYLEQGHQVIAVGSSIANGDAFLYQAKQAGAEKRAFYIQADLSLLEENKRIVNDIKNHFPIVDTLILCAAKHNKEYVETSEGYESTFALAYLSRFVICYGLKDCLEKSDGPVILNICGTGMKGDENWNDLQHKNIFDAMKVMMHGSRLNDLLGVAFVENDKAGKLNDYRLKPVDSETAESR